MVSSLWAQPQHCRHIEGMQQIPVILFIFKFKPVANHIEVMCTGGAGGVREGRSGVPFLLSVLMIDSSVSRLTCRSHLFENSVDLPLSSCMRLEPPMFSSTHTTRLSPLDHEQDQVLYSHIVNYLPSLWHRGGAQKIWTDE